MQKMKLKGLAVVLGILALCLSANAQQPAAPTASASQGNVEAKTGAAATDPTATKTALPLVPSQDEHYRIGPGDVLDIRILNRTNLSRESVRVEGNGAIRMPLIETDIQAACLTEGELSQEIAKRYLKFYRNPQVEVFIKDYRSTQVAIIGMVTEQGRFQLQRRIRLLELLAYAKGPGEKAGQTINVVHSGTAFQCEKDETGKEDINAGISSYRLNETLLGLEKANPYLLNGDIVTLPEADQVYVVGNVILPRSIALKEPVTVSRAIAMSGGLGKDSKTSKIRIVRQEPGSTTKKEIYVDLGAIEKKRADDIALVANDIVDVPISGTKSILRSMIGGLAPAVSQLPVRVVP
jgi:polysaccharide export outer membrane protein